MRCLRVGLLLSLLLAPGSSPSHAVVGGERMKYSMMMTRYVVGITYTGPDGRAKQCTGGIIGPQTVLTAAHCVSKNLSTMHVVVGDIIFHKDAVAAIPVVAARIHPKYEQSLNDWDNAYDLAVIKTRDPLPASSRHLQLAAANFPIKQIPSVYVIGFGITGWNKKGEAINDGTVNAAIAKRLDGDADDKFIKLDQKSGVGVCIGDSGGPMVVENADGFIVMGVASTVYNGDEKTSRLCSGNATYISAYYFRSWIMKQSFELMQLMR